MSDGALEALADLFELLEHTGALPEQQRFVCIFLLDNPAEAPGLSA